MPTYLPQPEPILADDVGLYDSRYEFDYFQNRFLEPDARGLMKRIIDRGLVEPKKLNQLMKDMRFFIESNRDHVKLYNLFLIYGHLHEIGYGIKIDNQTHYEYLSHLMNAYYKVPPKKDRVRPAKINTVGELDQVTAFIIVTAEVDHDDRSSSVEYCLIGNPFKSVPTADEEVHAIRIPNKKVNRFIIANPDKADRIAAFIIEHGVPRKGEPAALYEFFADSIAPSLDRGWL